MKQGVNQSWIVWVLAVMAGSLIGCTSASRAPVDDGSKPTATTNYPSLPKDCTKTWTVKKGDTLIGIALDSGADYRDIAAMNQLSNPNLIQADRTLCVLRRSGPPARKHKPASNAKPDAATDNATAARKPDDATPPVPAVPPTAGSTNTSSTASTAVASRNTDGIRFTWPAKGRVIAGFNDSSNKGLNIAGKTGDAVTAAADGKVVYAGAGLRGYGNLVIVKHDGNYLTAYAHNSKILVREGETVRRGQRIAEMGDSDADTTMLHFEIRRQGKPVDPLKYLSPRSS